MKLISVIYYPIPDTDEDQYQMSFFWIQLYVCWVLIPPAAFHSSPDDERHLIWNGLFWELLPYLS